MDTAILPVFRGFIMCNTAVLQVCQGSVRRILTSTGSISPVGCESTVSTRGTKILLKCAVSGFNEYVDHLCTVSMITSRSHSLMVPLVGFGSKSFRGGASRVPKVLPGLYNTSSRSIYGAIALILCVLHVFRLFRLRIPGVLGIPYCSFSPC